MARSLSIVLLVLSVWAAPALSQSSTGAVEQEYAVRFRLTVPDDWVVRRDHGGLRLIAFTPLSGPGDKFRENVNVVLEGLAAPMDLDDYLEYQILHMRSAMTGFVLVDRSTSRIADLEAMRIVYEHTMTEHRLRVLTYFLISGGRAYVITATATSDTYDKHVPSFEKVARSFHLP